jgi:hypothetical protein
MLKPIVKECKRLKRIHAVAVCFVFLAMLLLRQVSTCEVHLKRLIKRKELSGLNSA